MYVWNVLFLMIVCRYFKTKPKNLESTYQLGQKLFRLFCNLKIRKRQKMKRNISCRSCIGFGYFELQYIFKCFVYWMDYLLSRRYHSKSTAIQSEKSLVKSKSCQITSGKLFQILIDGFDLIFLVPQST